jgi:hypothetical protein
MSFLSQPISIIPIQPPRSIGGGIPTFAQINMQVVTEERTTDTLNITKQPVQQGAVITDHSFLEPTVFSSTAYFKDNSASLLSEVVSIASPSTGLAAIYTNLLALQALRTPFNIVTPKRLYNNMLLVSLSQTTDKHTENCLSVSMSFQQVIIVTASVVNIPRANQSNPGSNGATQQAGNQQSALLKTFNLGTGGNFAGFGLR